MKKFKLFNCCLIGGSVILVAALLLVSDVTLVQAQQDDVTSSSTTTTSTVKPSDMSTIVPSMSSTMSSDDEETSDDDNEDSSASSAPISESSSSSTTASSSADPGTDDYDPWADVEDDENDGGYGGTPNIVDQMRDLRENNLPNTRRVEYRSKNLNQSFARMAHAWGILDEYYLPSRKTWEKLLGMVTSLEVEVSPECFASYFLGVSGFRDYSAWAYRFLDVRGRLPESGTLHGQMASFGEYDECLELESPPSSSQGLVVKGQYCMLEVKVPYPDLSKVINPADPSTLATSHEHPSFKSFRRFLRNFRLHNLNTPSKMVEALQMANGTLFRAGLCIPALCKPEEIENLLNNLTYPIFQMPLQLGPNCFKKDQRTTYETHQLVAISLLTGLASFVIFCTVVEWYNGKYDKQTAKQIEKLGSLMFQRDVAFQPNPFLYCFSAITNTRSLLRSKSAARSAFTSLETLKFLMILYIHLYNYYNYQSTVGLVTLKRIFSTYPVTSLKDDRYAWFRVTLPFDVICTIAGLIVGFNVWQKLSGTTRFNYPLYVGKLWTKFALTYAGSILFLFALTKITHGPIWEYGMHWLDGCLNWKVLLFGFLFVSNYNEQLGAMDLPRQSVLPYCNPPTWFMSVLLQLLVVGPVLIYVGQAVFTCRLRRYLYFGVMTLVGVALSILPFYAFGVKPELQFLQFETLHETIMAHAWYRYGTNSYLICFMLGVIGGYFLTEAQLFLRSELETTLMIVALVLVQLTIALNNTFWRLDKSQPIYKSLIWYSLVRFAGSFGFAYILYTIASNRTNTIQRFLEWQPFVTLARLSYSYFMVHILVIFYRIFSVKEVHAMTDSQMLQDYLIDIMITLTLAYLFFCMVEGPVVNLLNLWQGKIFYDVEHYKPNQIIDDRSSRSGSSSGCCGGSTHKQISETSSSSIKPSKFDNVEEDDIENYCTGSSASGTSSSSRSTPSMNQSHGPKDASVATSGLPQKKAANTESPSVVIDTNNNDGKKKGTTLQGIDNQCFNSKL